MNEKHLPPLDLTGPASQVAERWRKMKRAFEYYVEVKDIENVRENFCISPGWKFGTFLKI